MIIGVLGEEEKDHRVALTPNNVAALKKLNVQTVLVERGAGEGAFLTDQQFEEKGATIADAPTILEKADIICKIHPLGEDQLVQITPHQLLIGQFSPLGNQGLVDEFLEKQLTTFSLDVIPRTTRAQAMDVLSSMSTVAGYRAILLAAAKLPKFFPMFMTAAGTIKPAKVLILGAGVAGLQAIATSRRLGAVVEAFDVRAAAKEEVLSLGAKFVEVAGATDDTSAGGYAVEQTEEYKKKQAALIQDHAIKSDVIICTAQIPGRKAPLLIQEATLGKMNPGSVVVDLAASTGGNCALTENNKTVQANGVWIIGDSNLAKNMPADASQMFGKNMTNFLKLLIDKEGGMHLNFEDDLVKGTCVTHQGQIINERVKRQFS